jgi:hypothetical protein
VSASNSNLKRTGQLLNAGLNEETKTGRFGCIDNIDETGVKGWYIDCDFPSEITAIELYIDQILISTTYPTHLRPDLSALIGRPAYAGFHFEWRTIVLNDAIKSWLKNPSYKFGIYVRLKGEDVFMVTADGSPSAADVAHWIKNAVVPVVTPIQKQKAIAAFETPNVDDAPDAVRAIAFYLPQYHPVPENDEWWGKGFTEWTNVAQAKPSFPGHDQPRIPSDLGYYDLRLPEVREQQAKLAKEYGIHGFCYYYYWFGGRRILERPLSEVIDSGKPDFPFCICWANESWSRRWDGSEHEVLLGQEHNFDNDVRFINDVIPVLKDDRYIKINGAPLLLIYRTELFPHPERTASAWRKICKEHGIEKIHLCAVESFGFNSPMSIGFDSSVQFPPHGIVAENITKTIPDLHPDFSGNIYDYEEVVVRELNNEPPPYQRFPGVMCGWDNTARRKLKGNAFINASPQMYEVWLRSAAERARQQLDPGERFVFINAWNEWAEGTYLEPDKTNGHAYLEATRRALKGGSGWRELLSYAKSKENLAGTERDNLLAELEHALVAQERSLKFLTNIHKNTLTDECTRVIMSSVAPLQVSASLHYSNGMCVLERVNSTSPMRNAIVAVPRQRWMYVSAWVVMPSIVVGAKSPAYFVMESLRTGERHYGLVMNRHERTDVISAYPEYSEGETRYSGIKCFIDVSKLPADQYRFGIIQFGEANSFIKHFEGTYEII